jgi:arylsulfatase A-like enzyme
MKLKSLFELVLLSLCLTAFKGCKNNAKEIIVKKPNVVFILADDLGLHDLGFTGSKYYETPNVDRIANEGTIFTQGYASSRVCSPSRASIMTGQFTPNHGITDWIGAASGSDWQRNDKVLPAEYLHALKDEAITLPEALKSGGYATFFAGKWHLGDAHSTPENNGYDINKGGWEVGSPKGGYFSPWENPKLPNLEAGENLSMRLAEETSKFISDNSETPFFAMLSFYAVHGPIQTTEERWRKYRDKADKQGIAPSGFEMERLLPIRTKQDNPVYAGLLEQMDEAIGLVLNTLDSLGLADNTIIVFTSDNGGVASGDAFSTTNFPLRGGKGYQWEGGIREPYIIKVPQLENAPREIDYPVAGLDFYPTLLDFAGVSVPEGVSLDGKSLKPLFYGQTLDERPLFWHYPHYGNQGGEPSSIIRKGDYKLIYYFESAASELYNLKDDPSEMQDIAAQDRELAKTLETELLNYLDGVGAKRPSPNPNYDVLEAQQTQEYRLEELLPRLEAERKEMLSLEYQPNANWWDSKVTVD